MVLHTRGDEALVADYVIGTHERAAGTVKACCFLAGRVFGGAVKAEYRSSQHLDALSDPL